MGQRSLEAQTLRSYGVPDAWFDELRRYGRLSDFHGGPPLRRGAVALMGLAVLAFLVRRTRTSRGDLLDLPARTLIIGLILLIAVPSKWPWHFGALMGIAAIAVATETHRIRSDDHRPRSWQARWLLAVAAITVAIAWSWGPRELWTLLDTNTVDWTPDSVDLILDSCGGSSGTSPIRSDGRLAAAPTPVERRTLARCVFGGADPCCADTCVYGRGVGRRRSTFGVDAGKTKRGIPSRRCGLRVGRHSLDSAAELDETAARNDKRAHAGPQIRLGTGHTSATPRAVPAPPARDLDRSALRGSARAQPCHLDCSSLVIRAVATSSRSNGASANAPASIALVAGGSPPIRPPSPREFPRGASSLQVSFRRVPAPRERRANHPSQRLCFDLRACGHVAGHVSDAAARPATTKRRVNSPCRSAVPHVHAVRRPAHTWGWAFGHTSVHRLAQLRLDPGPRVPRRLPDEPISWHHRPPRRRESFDRRHQAGRSASYLAS